MTKRRQNTIDRHIWLTKETNEALIRWAEEQGCSFSAAVESLARLGLGQEPATAFAPLLVSVIRGAILSQQAALIKVISHGAMEAAIASRLAQIIALMSIQERARSMSPDELAHSIEYLPADASMAAAIQSTYTGVKKAARVDAVRTLKRPLERLLDADIKPRKRAKAAAGKPEQQTLDALLDLEEGETQPEAEQ